MPDNFRKPVAAIQSQSGVVVVICDDGSQWIEYAQGTLWREATPIPGTRRAEELAREAQRGAA